MEIFVVSNPLGRCHSHWAIGSKAEGHIPQMSLFHSVAARLLTISILHFLLFTISRFYTDQNRPYIASLQRNPGFRSFCIQNSDFDLGKLNHWAAKSALILYTFPIMSNSAQHKTAARPLPQGNRSSLSTGLKIPPRSLDLRPRLRGNARGTRKELNPVSSSFPTKMGLRRIPRQILTTRPDAAMIRNARRGVMSKFLRSGIIIRASDLGSMADPKSAIISLTDKFEMETDYLSDEEDPMPEREKSLENLFYICVQRDELPSYHFWRGKKDPDPINVHRPVDWYGIVHSDPLAEMEYVQTGDSERETSPSNFPERLAPGKDSEGLSYEDSEAPESDESYATMEHKEGGLEFLDFYDDNSNGESNLYSEYCAQRTYQNV